jgi:hypothetical protein
MDNPFMDYMTKTTVCQTSARLVDKTWLKRLPSLNKRQLVKPTSGRRATPKISLKSWCGKIGTTGKIWAKKNPHKAGFLNFCCIFWHLEAGTGVEPVYTALQAAA